nr:adenylate kinase [Acinetobacter sp. Marseille-Q1620]
MRRMNVVGTSASGKTTFSRVLAKKLGLNYIELDDLFWLDDWKETPDTEFFKKIQVEIENSSNGYVIDGNYTRTTYMTWKEIDAVIWLDLPFSINLLQSIKRSVVRALSKKKIWENSNNTENLSRIFSQKSIIWWMIKTHRKNRKKNLARMKDPQYSHITFIRLSSRQQIQQFLDRI